MTIKEFSEFLTRVKGELDDAIDAIPPYSIVTKALYDAVGNIETAEAFFNREPIIPLEMSKLNEDEDTLTGFCAACEAVIFSNQQYCPKCGHKLAWK